MTINEIPRVSFHLTAYIYGVSLPQMDSTFPPTNPSSSFLIRGNSEMALAIPKPTTQARSISLPSRPHLVTSTVREHLYRLKSLSGAASSSSASSICQSLCCLRDLYESVNESLQLPLTQKTLSQEGHGKWAERVLDGSLSFLDICGTTRDTLAEIKESVQELQSSLRRKRSADSCPVNEVGAYMKSRKKINKTVSKCIQNLKTFEKVCSPVLLERHGSLLPIISMFREVEAVSVSVLKSLLSYASGANETSKQSGWKMVCKIKQKKPVALDIEEEADANEVERIEDALYALTTQKSCKVDNKAVVVQSVLKQLGTVDMALRELEEGLEPIFRCLLKTRVNLLNALNH